MASLPLIPCPKCGAKRGELVWCRLQIDTYRCQACKHEWFMACERRFRRIR